MTQEEKAWYDSGKLEGENNPNEHPDQIIQEDWNAGQSANARVIYGGFSNWLKISKSWAAGVKKGSTYFKNN